MSIAAEYLAALCDLGYTEQEARFVYLVATHSGYFTLQQYLDFTDTTKGWSVHEFTSKSIRLGHLRAMTCAYRTAVYNLFSRKVYGAIDRENLRNRRRLSAELIRTRLLILDFVLANPDLKYLETEAEKVAYFTEKFDIPQAVLPGRTYEGIEANAGTKRYFVDRFPIFVSLQSRATDASSNPTFVYCDTPSRSLLAYKTHLRNYENLLRRLPAFEFVYAAPTPRRFSSAERFFRNLFEESETAERRSIARYFRLRRLWDEEKHHLLTRPDRDFLRVGMQRYRDGRIESAYQEWSSHTVENRSPELVLDDLPLACKTTFRTHLLPRDYDIFDAEFGAESGAIGPDARSASRSDSRSVEEKANQF